MVFRWELKVFHHVALAEGKEAFGKSLEQTVEAAEEISKEESNIMSKEKLVMNPVWFKDVRLELKGV